MLDTVEAYVNSICIKEWESTILSRKCHGVYFEFEKELNFFTLLSKKRDRIARLKRTESDTIFAQIFLNEAQSSKSLNATCTIK